MAAGSKVRRCMTGANRWMTEARRVRGEAMQGGSRGGYRGMKGGSPGGKLGHSPPGASRHEVDGSRHGREVGEVERAGHDQPDRKSTRLNSSHLGISYAAF